MRCLCCGKPIPDSASDQEKSWGWHLHCVRSFFGTAALPEISLSEAALEELVNASVNRGLTVPGVQKKLSLHLETEPDARLTLVNYPNGYILKPQTQEYESLPEYEHMAMLMAERLGIRTVPHALIRMNGTYAYITRRIDRRISGNTVSLYAMEDFCQLSGRLTEDKYKGSYENCGKIIRRHSFRPGFDLSEFFLRLVFSFLTGNSDMHLKNFSLIENSPSSRVYQLSPAYDMLPVSIVLPEDHDQMALTVNGKRRNIRRKDFLILAENCGIPRAAAEHMTALAVSKKEELCTECDRSLLSEKQKEAVKTLIAERTDTLKGTP